MRVFLRQVELLLIFPMLLSYSRPAGPEGNKCVIYLSFPTISHLFRFAPTGFRSNMALQGLRVQYNEYFFKGSEDREIRSIVLSVTLWNVQIHVL